VKDNFSSNKTHDYKQVWQGHYTFDESPNLIRSTFDNASGLDIYQINEADFVKSYGKRGKQWSVTSKKNQTNFSFITVLYPYKGYSNRIDEMDKSPKFKGWKLNNTEWKIGRDNPISLTKKDKSLFFSVSTLELNNVKIDLSKKADIFSKEENNELIIQLISDEAVLIDIMNTKGHTKQELTPGEVVKYQL
jgi:hypothetical protein